VWGAGYRFATIYGGLTPYAAIQAQNFRTPSYSETDLNGGGFALAFNSCNATDTRSELGGRFDRLLLLNPSAALTLRGRVAWAHDWVSDPTLVPVFQALPGASFIVNGATLAKNSALTSAGAELRLANGVALLAKFDGEFASHSSTYAGTGTVRYTWQQPTLLHCSVSSRPMSALGQSRRTNAADSFAGCPLYLQ
jgi:outer membrane autotransporter protein